MYPLQVSQHGGSLDRLRGRSNSLAGVVLDQHQPQLGNRESVQEEEPCSLGMDMDMGFVSEGPLGWRVLCGVAVWGLCCEVVPGVEQLVGLCESGAWFLVVGVAVGAV